MNSFSLKLLACITMLIDHIGAIFFPDIMFIRIIGRVAFPIYAFLITEGYSRTKNLKRYMSRLFILAIISQIPYMLAFETKGLNVFFTLFSGIFIMIILDKKIDFYKLKHDSKIAKVVFEISIYIVKFVIILGILYILVKFKSDYAAYGVCIILCFKIFKGNFKKLTLSMIGLNILYTIPYLKYSITPFGVNFRVFLQATCISSLFFVYHYDGNEGKKAQLIFYGFYPAHLIVLVFIRYMLVNGI
ncbi:TraX family protein [Clostridium sp.]|uniref:TraX family protein n=1 Tax=Clostridium sp. TaxID=1506 RepID=UPI003217402E